MRGYIAPVSFGLVLSLLAIATVVGVGLAVAVHRIYLIPVVLGAAVGIGLLYILLLVSPEDALPAAPTAPPPLAFEPSSGPALGTSAPDLAPADPVDLEPGYDPVEEADRLDTEGTG